MHILFVIQQYQIKRKYLYIGFYQSLIGHLDAGKIMRLGLFQDTKARLTVFKNASISPTISATAFLQLKVAMSVLPHLRLETPIRNMVVAIIANLMAQVDIGAWKFMNFMVFLYLQKYTNMLLNWFNHINLFMLVLTLPKRCNRLESRTFEFFGKRKRSTFE